MERLYIAQGERGLFKVGMTTNLPRRLHSLRQEFRRRDDVIARTHAFDEVEEVRGAENGMIGWLERAHVRRGGREWFAEVDFELAITQGVAETRRVAGFKKATPEQIERWRQQGAEYAAQKAHFKAQHAAWLIQHEREVAHRHRIRQHGQHSFAALVDAFTDPCAAWRVSHIEA